MRQYASVTMATTHLISGLPCSGKTTYAVGLRADLNGVLFSLDRWLLTAFGKYAIAEVGPDEHLRRVLACRELIWDSAAELLKRGVDVILDDRFFLRDSRMRCIELSRRAGAGATIHFIDTPLSVIRARLEQRNARLPDVQLLDWSGFAAKPSSVSSRSRRTTKGRI